MTALQLDWCPARLLQSHCHLAEIQCHLVKPVLAVLLISAHLSVASHSPSGINAIIHQLSKKWYTTKKVVYIHSVVLIYKVLVSLVTTLIQI